MIAQTPMPGPLGRVIVLAVLPLLMMGHEARACGRKARCPSRYYRPVGPPQATIPYAPITATQPPPAPAVLAATAPAPQPSSEGPQPLYSYQAGQGGRPAYYYTYDSSGKLIVQQWMDWVFRGGRDAGMPRPPMPVVGWFQQP